MKGLFKGKLLLIVGILLGAAGGYLYWKFVGCTSGTCPITSSPLMSTMWGGAMGGLLLDLFRSNPVIKKK